MLRIVFSIFCVASMVVAAPLTASAVDKRRVNCSQSDQHESPIGGGIAKATILVHDINLGPQHIPTDVCMKAAYDRGSDWLDDTLNCKVFRHDSTYAWEFDNPSAFKGIPQRSFKVRFYGNWFAGTITRSFDRIDKACTARQTQISYFRNDRPIAIAVVTISWDRPFKRR
jgi:hypothetical protein